MKDTINWGILGCSTIAVEKVIPAVKRTSNVNISALASRDKRTSEYYCQKFGIKNSYGSYEELLNDPSIDAVYVSLPNSLHCEWSIKAAQKGKHILCEKPSGINPVEIKEMLDECEKNNVLFLEGFMYRFHPQHERVKELISNGTIGEVKLITVSFSFPLSERHSKIKLDKSLGGGCLLDIGCYCIDASRWLFESEPLSVYAQAIISKEHGVDTSFIGVLNFSEGKRAIIDCSFEMFRRNSYEIVGTKGKIDVPNAFTPTGITQITIINNEIKFTEDFLPVNLYLDEFFHYSQCISKKMALNIDPINSYKNSLIISLLMSSNEKRQAVINV